MSYGAQKRFSRHRFLAFMRKETLQVMREVLRDTMALSGALFALLIAATMFTLVLRIFGTDRWVADLITGLQGGSGVVLAAVLLTLALSALTT